ncbi:hypothetical protein NPIL_595331 [Nephila pilipes]|uniref:Uncharacterized protein n=1 Tax=Nephila pilipes TaxID=299642 RepID=A0A8X6N0W3_NEPPI|nr:hypothetical protein NPIL_595331 [Nephila pilipes]
MENAARTDRSTIEKTRIEVMLIAFFDNTDLIRKELLPEKAIKNAYSYKDVLVLLLQKMHRHQRKAVKSKRLDGVVDIESHVTRVLHAIPKENFARSFQELYSINTFTGFHSRILYHYFRVI